MKRIIITAIGKDAPGLVNKITSIINQNNGNIENSKMIKIKNQFAMIIDFCSTKNRKSWKRVFTLPRAHQNQVFHEMIQVLALDARPK